METRHAFEDVVARLEPGGHLVASRRLAGGVSADVFGLDIAAVSGVTRRVVFRQHRAAGVKDDARRVTAKEHALLDALHRRGLAVPRPHLLAEDVDRPYLVTEWIDGTTTVEPDAIDGALDQLATFLVGLHALDPTGLAVAELEPIEDPASAIGRYLPPDEIGERVRARLRAGLPDRPPVRSVLVHGDYWPGNVLWRDGRLAAVIDWEDACIGDPLADLAGARVELLCQYGTAAVEQFTDRYRALYSEEIEPLTLLGLPLWEVYVSAAALATMHRWALPPDEEVRRRRLTGSFFARAASQL